MHFIFSIVLFCIPTALCVSRVQSDEKDNLVINAEQGRNISMFGNAMFVNGAEVATSSDKIAIFNSFQTLISLLNRTMQAEISTLTGENQKLRDQIALLNVSTVSQQEILASFTTQTTSEIVNVFSSKLGVLQPLIQQSCTSNPSLSLPPFQQIETSGAFDWEYFTINNTGYLVVANQYNGSSNDIPSNIYRFDPLTQQFVLFQQIGTKNAVDWKYFYMNNTHYLAVSQEHDISFNLKSDIYRFDYITSQFVLFQQIDTSGADDCEYFTMNGTGYLAVANHHNGVSYNAKSSIYRFDTITQQFLLFQEIDTIGAYDWEYFMMNNSHYLVVANHFNGSEYNLKSCIYRFNITTQQFVLFQQINTNGALDWLYYVGSDNASYLAVANNYNSASSHLVKSNIYRFNTISQQFVLFQQVETSGARDWEYFTIGHSSFLAVANRQVRNTYNVTSSIYRIDLATSQLSLYEQISTIGAHHAKYFKLEDFNYLAIASHFNGTSFNMKSNIYRFANVAACWDID